MSVFKSESTPRKEEAFRNQTTTLPPHSKLAALLPGLVNAEIEGSQETSHFPFSDQKIALKASFKNAKTPKALRNFNLERTDYVGEKVYIASMPRAILQILPFLNNSDGRSKAIPSVDHLPKTALEVLSLRPLK